MPTLSEATWLKEQVTPESLRDVMSYDAETGKLTWLPRDREMFPSERSWKWWNKRWAGTPALASKRADGYFGGTVYRQHMLAHRAIWAIVRGEWPEQIDHINHDRGDNRIENLRSVCHRLNARNQKLTTTNTSGRSGVHQCRRDQLWIARFYVGGRRVSRYFKTFADACAARDEFERANGYHPNHGKQLEAA